MCVICVQWLASGLETLKNPISEGRREELEGDVKYCKEAIQGHKDKIESFDSESCPKGNRS